MGVKKRVILPGSAPGSSALQRKNSSSVMVIDHSSYSTSYATLPRPGKGKFILKPFKKILNFDKFDKYSAYSFWRESATQMKYQIY